MNYLLYIGGFPFFYYFLLNIITGFRGFTVKGWNFLWTAFFALMVWVWICIQISNHLRPAVMVFK